MIRMFECEMECICNRHVSMLKMMEWLPMRLLHSSRIGISKHHNFFHPLVAKIVPFLPGVMVQPCTLAYVPPVYHVVSLYITTVDRRKVAHCDRPVIVGTKSYSPHTLNDTFQRAIPVDAQ